MTSATRASERLSWVDDCAADGVGWLRGKSGRNDTRCQMPSGLARSEHCAATLWHWTHLIIMIFVRLSTSRHST